MSFSELLQTKLGEHSTENVIILLILLSFIFLYFLFLIMQIEELILDKLFKIEKLTEDHKISIETYPSLIYLSLIDIGLDSLENFPFLKNLEIVSYLYIY